MTPERDKTKIRFVGALSVGCGTIMLVLDFFVTLFRLVSGPGYSYAQTGISFILMLIVASTLMSCGTQLTRLRLYTSNDVQVMRLNWTALVIVMVVGGLIAYATAPTVAYVCALEIIALFAIRGSVIRLSA